MYRSVSARFASLSRPGEDRRRRRTSWLFTAVLGKAMAHPVSRNMKRYWQGNRPPEVLWWGPSERSFLGWFNTDQDGMMDGERRVGSNMPTQNIPAEYKDWLRELKDEIRQARGRAALAVKSEMILLYWRIGREILDRQAQHGWGTRVIDRLAADLRAEFPDVKGFSPRNLKYMRKLAEEWPDLQIVQQVVAQFAVGPECRAA